MLWYRKERFQSLRSAFSFNTDICSITLPDSLERIEYYAILGCESMVSLEIPESVTYIGDHAVGYYVSDYGDFYSIGGFTIIGSTGSTAETYAAQKIFLLSQIQQTDSAEMN